LRCIQSDGAQHDGAGRAVAAAAAYAQLDIARGALPGTPLVECVLRALDVVTVDDRGIVAADQFLAREAEKPVEPLVDEGETPDLIQRVDEVGRLVDEIPVQAFGLLEPAADAHVLALQ